MLEVISAYLSPGKQVIRFFRLALRKIGTTVKVLCIVNNKTLNVLQ